MTSPDLYFQISFGAVSMMGLEGGLALGLFAAGCAPGGSGSNMYTFLLDGDVSLSVTMTLVSTLASLGNSFYLTWFI